MSQESEPTEALRSKAQTTSPFVSSSPTAFHSPADRAHNQILPNSTAGATPSSLPGRSKSRSFSGSANVTAPQAITVLPKTPRPLGEDSPATPGNRRGVNANHLLNFTLPPRQHPPGSSNRRGKTPSYQPFNKERFVNANFRFIVSSLGDYDRLVLHPDEVVDWETVEQAVIVAPDIPACPICLCLPTPPKLARCGHVFCYPCILHYIDLGERQWRKCPICYDSIYAKDLKSVLFQAVRDFSKLDPEAQVEENHGENSAAVLTPHRAVLKLMQRATGSTVALPRPLWRNWALTGLPCCERGDTPYLPYARILVGSNEYMTCEILDKEKAVLMAALEESQSDVFLSSDVPYLEAALNALKIRYDNFDSEKHHRRQKYLAKKSDQPQFLGESLVMRQSLQSQQSSPLEMNDVQLLELPPPVFPLDPNEPVLSSSSKSYTPEAFDIKSTKSQSLKSTSDRRASRLNSDEALFYYFYQAADGQHLYLNPLDIKILKTQYGDYSRFPDEICVRLTVVEETTLNEEVRKRYKYLSHLPLSCDVSFAEIDWSDPTLNTCRQTVTCSTATSPLSSPSCFTLIGKHTKMTASDKEPKRLISDAVFHECQADIKARIKKRERKKHKEEKSAKQRRPSLDDLGSTDAHAALQAGPHRRSPTGIFDFEDEQSWQPLPSSLASPTPAPQPQQSSSTFSYAKAARALTYEEENPSLLSSSFPPPNPSRKISDTNSRSFASILNPVDLGSTDDPSGADILDNAGGDGKKKGGRRKKKIVLMATSNHRGY